MLNTLTMLQQHIPNLYIRTLFKTLNYLRDAHGLHTLSHHAHVFGRPVTVAGEVETQRPIGREDRLTDHLDWWRDYDVIDEMG